MRGSRRLPAARPQSQRERGAASRFVVCAVAGATVLGLAGAYGGVSSRQVADEATVAPTSPKASYGSLPLAFEANRGQTDAGVDFLARGSGYGIFVTPSEAVLTLKRSTEAATGTEAAEPAPGVLRMQVLGGDPAAQAFSRDALPGKVNHLVGDRSEWKTGIPTFGKVGYSGIYPGVDMVYYGGKGGLEYDFVVAPGADPSAISLGFAGTDSVRLADNGDLLLGLAGGELRQTKPVLYQEVGGRKVPVEGSFVLKGDGRVGFSVGAFDAARPLVIDPVLDYSTFLGGSTNDFGWGIAVDSDGYTYLGGETSSAVFPRGNDTPAGGTAGGYQPTLAGSSDGYVLKMDPTGSALVYATYIGGSNADSGQDLAIDSLGRAYLTGSTVSGSDNSGTTLVTEVAFPTTATAYDGTCGTDGTCNDADTTDALLDNAGDHFLARLSAAGNALEYSTFLGGSSVEQHAPGTPYSGSAGIAVRGTTAYLHSNTFSDDFPVTAKAFQKTCASCSDGTSDGYVTGIDTDAAGAASLAFSSYLGGDGDEQSKDIAVDESGNAYVIGITVSTKTNRKGDPTGSNSFPSKGALQADYGGGYSDAYVAKINPDASRARRTLVYSTMLGGGGTEEGWGIAVRDGKAYVTGYTTSGQNPHPAVAGDPAPDPLPYFPTTTGAYDTSYNGRASTESGSTLFLDGDAFVTVLDPSGGAVVWSTFLGGPAADYGQDIALDSAGQVYITGWTTCREQDNRLTTGVNEAPARTTSIDDDGDPSTPPIVVNTGRNPGDPDETGVGDCDGLNPHGTTSPPAGVFPQVNPIVDPARGLNESAMDATYLGFELHNSPTGVFVANLTADGAGVDYAVLLDGPGFDRGFGIAVRDRDAEDNPLTPEAYVTGRTGRQGYPVVASTTPFATLYDGTYNGAGRDAFISKLVG